MDILKNIFCSTEDHKKYWIKRKIDWKKEYQTTVDHPHRQVIIDALSSFNWVSLMEIGCGGGANLIKILKTFKGRQVGGIDINPEAIALCNQTFGGGMFKVNSADDIFMSDKSTDVLLSDMTLIYSGRFKIHKYIREIKRITRNYVVLCEFHSDSWWNRLMLKLHSGYNAYDYKKLLKKHGFYDISLYKLKEDEWPGGNPQKTFGYVIVAKIPKI